MISSPMPQRGPEASQRASFAIFMRSAASALSAPCANTIWSLPLCERVELVWCRQGRRIPAAREISSRRQVAERRRSGEPSADSRAAEASLLSARQACIDLMRSWPSMARPAADLPCPERERHGILQMRAVDLGPHRGTPCLRRSSVAVRRPMAGRTPLPRVRHARPRAWPSGTCRSSFASS